MDACDTSGYMAGEHDFVRGLAKKYSTEAIDVSEITGARMQISEDNRK